MFFSKKIKYLLVLTFFLIFIILTFITVDSGNRRSIISKTLVLHDFYRIKSLTHGLQIRDFSLLSKKLEKYINFSKKFSQGKTYMFPGIYEATELVVSRAITQDDYNKIENVLKQLLEFDNRIYKLHVWYARALSDDDYKKALDHIDIAIKISPSETDAYREALYIAQNTKNFDLANSYCQKYKNSFLGGNKPLHFATLFDSFNNQKFSVSVNKIKNHNLHLINSNFILNKNKIYEFIFEEPTDLNGIDLYFAPINNLILKINKIDYISNGVVDSIDLDYLTITSNHSFILENDNNSFNVLLAQIKEELLRIRHKNVENVEKLNLSMEIIKSNLTNNNLCKINK